MAGSRFAVVPDFLVLDQLRPVEQETVSDVSLSFFVAEGLRYDVLHF